MPNWLMFRKLFYQRFLLVELWPLGKAGPDQFSGVVVVWHTPLKQDRYGVKSHIQ